MSRTNSTSIPTMYLFLSILLNLFLIFFFTLVPPNIEFLPEIASITVLLSRAIIGLYLGSLWFKKVKRDIYPTDWIQAILINGILLIILTFIASILFPDIEENLVLWPYSGFILFLGTDILLTLFIVFGDLFVGEGAFIMAIVVLCFAGFFSLGFPFFIFTLGVVFARLRRKKQLNSSTD